MAGKRVYITIPQEDYELFSYWATLGGECRGQLARRLCLEALYRALKELTLLQAYEEGIQARRREKVLRGRVS